MVSVGGDGMMRKRGMGRRGQALRWLAVLVLPLVLASCGANLSGGGAGAARANLDAQILYAQSVGVPASVVDQLTARERHIDGQRGWFGLSDGQAAVAYGGVMAQARQSVTDATASTSDAANSDLHTLTTTVQRAIGAGIIPATFTDHVQAMQDAFTRATLPNDYQNIDGQIVATRALIDAMTGATNRISTFAATVEALRHLGLPVTLETVELDQARAAYAASASAADYQRLSARLDAETLGLVSSQTQAIPYLGNALLDDLQTRITTAQGFGENVQTAQASLATDRAKLGSITTLGGYLALKGTVASQADQLAIPLIRGQARQDLAQLRGLLHYCEIHGIMDYEYVGDTGIGSAEADLAAAHTTGDYQTVDGEIAMLLANLRAMIANQGDTTPANQAHATDLDLAKSYGVQGGRVVVVSLREQAMRAYDNGRLVFTTYITSGRPELPSPPGFWHVLAQQSPIIFTSAEQPGDPFYYAPITVHYALLFHDGGFYLHDAWWRVQFGPGSNLPHYDPEAFNGGSHGCVNLPLQQMTWLYGWANIGTPVLVY